MKEKEGAGNIPRHVAVIMDGNGRWAKQKGAARIFGHKNAIQAVRDTTERCAELGVDHLTMYAFSTENWSRPKQEVDGLMSLLVSTIKSELPTLQKNKVRLSAIGDVEGLSTKVRDKLMSAIEETKSNDGLNLILALNYSGKWDLMEAIKKIGAEVKQGELDPKSVDAKVVSDHLSTSGIPDPELLIRTSGEMRISNFLLWQLAYSELYFTDVLWPDFRKKDMDDAIAAYQNRERRFGKTSEQLTV